MKSGFAVVVGRPSSGKSTLVNALCGHKVSIVSAVPQTTRRSVRGIAHSSAGQVVFLDTPGFHVSEKEFNRSLNDMVNAALKEDPDVVVYVLDLTRKPGTEEAACAQLLSSLGVKPIIVFNKCDLISPQEGEEAQENFKRFLSPYWESFETATVSSIEKQGLDQLTQLLFNHLEEGFPLYPEDCYTDQTPEFRIAEVIREKAMNRLSQELPHSLYVEVADLECPTPQELWIRAFICVERESQKGMVIGKEGVKLGAIRKAAKRELKNIFSQSIRLDLRVKVNQNWRKNRSQINSILKLN